MLTEIILHCYVGDKIRIGYVTREITLGLHFFVVGPKASHLPNIDNTPMPCTVISLGSRLLLIMVNLSLCDEENIQLL
jgi:hypothetical protein